MFEQFGKMIYEACAYRVEEVEKNRLYRTSHTDAARREKWSKVVFVVKITGDGAEFDCECGMYAHMGMLCGHALKASHSRMNYLKLPMINMGWHGLLAGRNCFCITVLTMHLFFFAFLQVMDYLGVTDIPEKHIMKRWTRYARDVLPEHLRHYQRDHAAGRNFTKRHSTLYVQAMELVRLGDTSI
jgi:hypothetical protein